MLIRVRKWGNSLALRIPAPLAREAGINEGMEVHLALDTGRIVITPPGLPYTLDALVDGVTAENLHGAIDTGPRLGAEGW